MSTLSPAEQVKWLRKSLDMSQEELGRMLGLSFQTVNRWENGQTKPSSLAESLLDCLAKIVAAKRGGLLIDEYRRGDLGAGGSRAYSRIFSLAFEAEPTPVAAPAPRPAALAAAEPVALAFAAPAPPPRLKLKKPR